jgi:hypothetical protein
MNYDIVLGLLVVVLLGEAMVWWYERKIRNEPKLKDIPNGAGSYYHTEMCCPECRWMGFAKLEGKDGGK